MTDTKEKILQTALALFARDGYEAVSVSRIAGELGMTKGALYKHYKNKRDIFDRIVERMYQVDSERARQYAVPEETKAVNAAAYGAVSMESVRDFAVGQFLFWTEDAFASDFRRMLSLEQYRNAEMAELYRNCLTAGPVAYMEDIFCEMTAQGVLEERDPKELAVAFYAPMYLLIAMADGGGEKGELLRRLEAHMEEFMRCYGRTDGDGSVEGVCRKKEENV